MMNFEEIEQLHAEWSKMEDAAKLGWLTQKRIRLTQLSKQFAQYIYLKGGFFNDEERRYARELLEMTKTIDIEGQKVFRESINKALKDVSWSQFKK